MSRTQAAINCLALGAIVAACATGCSLISPAAPPGSRQQQISRGAKAGAGGRSPAAPARAAPASRATGAKAGTAGRARAKAMTAGHTAAQVHGRDITAVGDSVMLAVASALQRAFPGIYIDAAVSRRMDAGVSVLRQLAATGRLRPVVIVGLGTNGGVTTQQVRQLMATVGSKRTVVLVNTFVPLPYEHGTNEVLAAAARSYPNVALANWYHTISARTGLLWPDGIHPQPSAGKVYATMIKTAVTRAVQPGSAGGR